MKKSSLVALAFAAIAFGAVAQTDGGTAPRQTITATHEVAAVTAIRHVDGIGFVCQRGGQALQIADQEATQARPLVALLRADQYELHQLARNRPEVTPQWRLVASV